jgi:hypothetical protein
MYRTNFPTFWSPIAEYEEALRDAWHCAIITIKMNETIQLSGFNYVENQVRDEM